VCCSWGSWEALYWEGGLCTDCKSDSGTCTSKAPGTVLWLQGTKVPQLGSQRKQSSVAHI